MEENSEHLVGASSGLQSQTAQHKLAQFIGDVLQQLQFLQGIASDHITEIAALQTQVEQQQTTIEEIQAFNRALKLRLRQQRENGL